MLASAAKVFSSGQTFYRLWEGLQATVKISCLSLILSMAAGLVLGYLMLSQRPFWRAATRLYLEAIRVIPVLTFLFLFYYLVSRLWRINLDSLTVVLLTFTIWGAGEMADLVRGAVTSIPAHQRESGMALGLTEFQLNVFVIAPQAVRRLIPGVINLATRMIKNTPLVFFINVPELITVGQQVVEVAATTQNNRQAAFWVYGLIFFIFFFVCYPISRLSKRLEERYRY